VRSESAALSRSDGYWLPADSGDDEVVQARLAILQSVHDRNHPPEPEAEIEPVYVVATESFLAVVLDHGAPVNVWINQRQRLDSRDPAVIRYAGKFVEE
jgi:hypothetical protein